MKARRNFGAVSSWGRSVIKSELVQRMAARNPHLYQRDIENIIDAILGEITNALARGERVELRGFGAFSTKQRQARTGRNPRTGDKVPVTEKLAPFFKTGKEMRERLNRAAVERSRIVRTPPGHDGSGWAGRADEACMVRFLKIVRPRSRALSSCSVSRSPIAIRDRFVRSFRLDDNAALVDRRAAVCGGDHLGHVRRCRGRVRDLVVARAPSASLAPEAGSKRTNGDPRPRR